MSRVIDHHCTPSPADRLSILERKYEEWARVNGLNPTQTPRPNVSGGCVFASESFLHRPKMAYIRSATRMTLYPNTWERLPILHLCFASVADALAHDWLMVGADLYSAVKKTRIALPSAGDSATTRTPAATAR